ncbi:SDR family oxidoreductase [Mycolicibacterium sp. F2034L]|uniref:SDR family oxidoreductase n=1 Tax=Mycolicibacterium sp. F2034L TaxID=2926422 RepID=UPI001FF4673B|nr:SDR family oxidoreductase [Mycolicibacterium sp. F2034L]MCK0177085.1 SDR family oxidoreductase [Mycolicibacterium sp. F2034L]
MPTALVTGASRGIGRAIIAHLAAQGWDVIAGVRNDRDAAEASALDERITPVLLDVTDPDQVAALPTLLPATLDAVVNNAGIAVAGPVETVSPGDWRKQFEVNVFGQIAVTQAVLPKLRQSRGRVIFVSSLNGQIAMPLLGAYSASKFALEACADALRVEVRPWGIAVVVVEPAQTDTDMWRGADDMVRETEAAMPAHQRDLYARHLAGMKKFVPAARKLAVPTEKVVAVVDRALTANRPRARYAVGVGPKAQLALMTNVPTAVRDRVLATMTRIPRQL